MKKRKAILLILLPWTIAFFLEINLFQYVYMQIMLTLLFVYAIFLNVKVAKGIRELWSHHFYDVIMMSSSFFLFLDAGHIVQPYFNMSNLIPFFVLLYLFTLIFSPIPQNDQYCDVSDES